uniref:Uncharacterized protein n=1 Tax=Ciona intestinalis TaxID=7719 RepID=H2XXS9_CIOIN
MISLKQCTDFLQIHSVVGWGKIKNLQYILQLVKENIQKLKTQLIKENVQLLKNYNSQ